MPLAGVVMTVTVSFHTGRHDIFTFSAPVSAHCCVNLKSIEVRQSTAASSQSWLLRGHPTRGESQSLWDRSAPSYDTRALSRATQSSEADTSKEV